MQTTTLQSLHLQPPSSSNFTRRKRLPSRRNGASIRIMAIKGDEKSKQDGYSHKLVDENMIVLKMRIQEMRRKEQEDDWEKEWYKNYDYDVYEVVGLLQSLLMDTRPSLALGVVALFIFSVSTPLALLFSYFLNIIAM